MFLIFFSITLIFANIYCFIKKKYLSLFFPCFLLLPNFYAIEISKNFPLITITRVMILVLYLYAFFNRKRFFSFKEFLFHLAKKEYLFLLGYFIFRIIPNLFYITTYRDAIQTIFSIIFEQFAVLLAKSEQFAILKSVLWAATFLFIVGIFESLTSIRLFDNLYTVSRPMLNNYYIRLGLLRSVTTMGLPNFYGNMCILVTPLLFYVLYLTRRKSYIISLALDLLAIIQSGCRSDLIFYFLISFIYLILIFKDKIQLRLFLKHFFFSFAIVFVWILVLSANNESARYFYSGTAKSLLNTFGFDFDLNANAPTGVSGYGDNEDGTYSRLFQISAIDYTLKTKPFFGLGSGCESRGDIRYNYKGVLKPGYGFDVGIVQVICSEGLFGMIGYCSLFISLFIVLFKAINKQRFSIENSIFFLLIISYLLCTLSTSNMPFFLTTISVMLYTRNL